MHSLPGSGPYGIPLNALVGKERPAVRTRLTPAGKGSDSRHE
jgi:hypothetical protein